jgi:hypothetical protein
MDEQPLPDEDGPRHDPPGGEPLDKSTYHNEIVLLSGMHVRAITEVVSKLLSSGRTVDVKVQRDQHTTTGRTVKVKVHRYPQVSEKKNVIAIVTDRHGDEGDDAPQSYPPEPAFEPLSKQEQQAMLSSRFYGGSDRQKHVYIVVHSSSATTDEHPPTPVQPKEPEAPSGNPAKADIYDWLLSTGGILDVGATGKVTPSVRHRLASTLDGAGLAEDWAKVGHGLRIGIARAAEEEPSNGGSD